MSDDNLDNLFKKGLSGRNVAFNMDSWRKMEQMLPAEAKPAGFRFGMVSALVGGAVLLFGSFMLWSSLKDDNSFDSRIYSSNLEVQNDNALSNSGQNELRFGMAQNVTVSKSEALVVSEVSEVEKTIDRSTNSNSMEESSSVSASKLRKMGVVKNASITNNSNSNKTAKSFFAKNDGFKSLAIKRVEPESLAMNISRNGALELDKLDGVETFALTNSDEHTLFAEMGNSKFPKLKRNEFGFLGGVNITGALVNSSQNEISGCEVLGLSYQRYFNGGFSLIANLLYAPRNEVNSIKYFDKKIYGFGSVTEQTMVESQRLVYLELPLMMNYNVGNHNFMAGPSLSYLVTGLHKVSTEYVTQTETTIDDSMQWGHTNGFNNFDFALVAGYEYSIKPKLNIGMRLNYGLMDVTRNEYFGSDSFDNNVQFRVYLKYAPFQF